MEALGLDPAQLDLAQSYNPDQPRVPAGNGLESGRWTSGDNNSVDSTGWNTTEQFQMARIVEDLEAAMGGTLAVLSLQKGPRNSSGQMARSYASIFSPANMAQVGRISDRKS